MSNCFNSSLEYTTKRFTDGYLSKMVEMNFLPNEPVVLDRERKFFEINVSVCPVLRIPIHYSIIKSRKIYNLLFRFINRIKYLNFVFHLYDFINIDVIKLRYVLDLITSQRKVMLSKDITTVYRNNQ